MDTLYVFANPVIFESDRRFKSRPVVLKLVGSIEPNRCHASIHRTLNYNQERIQKILEGDAVLN